MKMVCKYCKRETTGDYCRLRCAVLSDDCQYVLSHVEREFYTYIANDCYSVEMLEVVNASDYDVTEALINTTSVKQADAIIKYYDSNFIQQFFGDIKSMGIIEHIVNNYNIGSPKNLLKKIAKHRDATTQAAVRVISKILEFGGDCNDFTPKQMRKLREKGLVYIKHS